MQRQEGNEKVTSEHATNRRLDEHDCVLRADISIMYDSLSIIYVHQYVEACQITCITRKGKGASGCNTLYHIVIILFNSIWLPSNLHYLSANTLRPLLDSRMVGAICLRRVQKGLKTPANSKVKHLYNISI